MLVSIAAKVNRLLGLHRQTGNGTNRGLFRIMNRRADHWLP